MTFDEAERKFRDLQARVQRGEPTSRADYEAMVAELAVQDDRGVLWEINPRTGKWMYFDGAEWVVGRPPGHDQSTVMSITQTMTPPGATPPPMPRSQFAAATAPRPPTQTPTGNTPAPMPKSQIAPPPPAPRPATTQPPQARPAGATPPPLPKPQFTPAMQPRPGAAEPSAPPRPPSPGAPPPPESVRDARPGGGLQGALRSAPLGGPNREWIPLAIGAVVLLMCAAGLFAFSVLNNPGGFFGGPSRTPTRTVVRATSTALLPTPFPTAPPATPTTAPVLAKINVASANVRATPSTSGKIVTTLKNGTQITLIGRSADSQWFQINVAGQPAPGWISIQVFQIASGDPNSLPVPGAAAPTPTKQSIAPQPPAAAQFTPTPTVIGAPTATPSS